MWALELEDMAVAVVRRIPLRTDRTDTYFAAEDIQMMPRDGYTAIFAHILDHPRISLRLGTIFHKEWVRDFDFCFNSMAIEEYFEFVYGDLPYRSIRQRCGRDSRSYARATDGKCYRLGINAPPAHRRY